jgi:hypothetical protein
MIRTNMPIPFVTRAVLFIGNGFAQTAGPNLPTPNVRFWVKPNMAIALQNVRFRLRTLVLWQTGKDATYSTARVCNITDIPTKKRIYLYLTISLVVSLHAAHSNGRLSWSGLSGGLIRVSHVGAPHLAHFSYY